ncbi:MAG: biopolymer transporter ExbD [Gemmataceae bacterium]|nr:biopolymer transporter ExbD [Gemmataceae bacterium]
MDFQRRRRIDANIDMTPMIDTLLQLFVTFLLSMSFIASAVTLSLPRASAGKSAPSESIVVSIDAQQQLSINRELVARPDLRDRLAGMLRNDARRPVVLRADRSLAYEKILDVLVVIQQAGSTQVHLAYQERE